MSTPSRSTALVCMVLALSLAVSGCTVGPKGFDPDEEPVEVDLGGKWLMHLETFPESGMAHGNYEELFITFIPMEDQMLMYLDLDWDLAFAEGVSLPVIATSQGIAFDSAYTFDGAAVSIDAELDYPVWGYLTGTWSKTVGGQRTDYNAVALRVANPPIHDLEGLWSMTLNVDWTTAGLAWLTGSSQQIGWDIQQEDGGPLDGALRITDTFGRQFIGVVNNSQVTLGRRFEDSMGLVTYIYTLVQPTDDWMTGSVQADVENSDGEHQIKWYFDGFRASLASTPAGDTSILLFDDRAEAGAESESILLVGPSGDVLVEVGGEHGSSAWVPLEPGRWSVWMNGSNGATAQVFEVGAAGPIVLRLSSFED